MRRTVGRTAAVILAASLSLFGCSSETPTAVQLSAPFFTRPPAAGFDVLRRSSPLAADLSVTALIGVNGGRLDIPEAGLSLVIPEGALPRETHITATALAGDAVAFEFAPHGLEFEVTAEIRIQAQGTRAADFVRGLPQVAARTTLDSFLGVYYEGDPSVGVEPLENIGTYLLDGAIVFRINHFSGYACAEG